MKKLFTLAAALLASFSLWAADPNLETSGWGENGFATVITTHDDITLTTSATSWSGNFSGTQYIALGGGTDLSASSPSPYFGIIATSFIDSVEVFWAPNGTNNTSIAWAAWTDADNFLKQDVDFLDKTETYKASKSLDDAIWQKINLAGKEAKALVLTRQLKKAKLNGAVQSNLGDNQTVNILGIRVWLAPTGDPTKATLKSISVDGTPLADFAVDKLTYDIELPFGTTAIPTVTAKTGDLATVAITQATELPGAATVVCTSGDGNTTVTYTINFTVKATGNNDATLSDLKVNGVTVAGFASNVFEYHINVGIYEEVVVTATATDPNAKKVEIAEDPNDEYVQVTVTAEDGTTYLGYLVYYVRGAATALDPISTHTTWDFTKAGSKEIKFTDETLVKKGVTEFNFADVLPNPDASFNAAALNGVGEYAVRDTKYFQGSLLKFQTLVPGKLEVIYSNTGNRAEDQDLERILTINGTKIGNGALRSDKNVTESDIDIEIGTVEISSVLKADETVQYIRIYKVTFQQTGWPTGCENTEAAVKAVKVIRDGQLFIEKNGVLYNAQGAVVK